MKRGLTYTAITIVIIIIAPFIKTALEKPKIDFLQSLDHSNSLEVHSSNEEYLIEKGNTGLLIIHGLGASPYQTRELADFLSKEDITVYSIRLSGHGTTLNEFEDTKYQKWIEDSKKGFEFLKQKTEKTYILGISLGASLAIELAAGNGAEGLILIAPPIYMKNELLEWVGLIKIVKRYHHTGVDSTQLGHAYENMPTKSLHEFLKLVRSSKEKINQIDEQTLIIQSNMDGLVDPKSAQYVYDNIQSKQKDLVFVDNIHHGVVRIYEADTPESVKERKEIFNKISEFLIK